MRTGGYRKLQEKAINQSNKQTIDWLNIEFESE